MEHRGRGEAGRGRLLGLGGEGIEATVDEDEIRGLHRLQGAKDGSREGPGHLEMVENTEQGGIGRITQQEIKQEKLRTLIRGTTETEEATNTRAVDMVIATIGTHHQANPGLLLRLPDLGTPISGIAVGTRPAPQGTTKPKTSPTKTEIPTTTTNTTTDPEPTPIEHPTTQRTLTIPTSNTLRPPKTTTNQEETPTIQSRSTRDSSKRNLRTWRTRGLSKGANAEAAWQRMLLRKMMTSLRDRRSNWSWRG